MKYMFVFVQMVTLIWLVNAFAFPQEDRPNEISSDSNNTPSTTTQSTTTTTTRTTDCPCIATAEYNPVCGTNNVTYWNMGRFNCAKQCNPSLEVRVIRACEPYSQLSSN